MSTSLPPIRLGHLYPDHLNIYADRGNIAVFQRRLEWRGLSLEVEPVGLGDDIPGDCHLYYLGGGQDRDQLLVAEDLARKADPLRRAADDGAAVLAVCGGYQLMGHSYITADGQKMAGTGLLDLETAAATDRLIGDVVLSVTLDGHTSTVVGYENHAGRTRLGPGCTPLGQVQQGHGNNGGRRLRGGGVRSSGGHLPARAAAAQKPLASRHIAALGTGPRRHRLRAGTLGRQPRTSRPHNSHIKSWRETISTTKSNICASHNACTVCRRAPRKPQ